MTAPTPIASSSGDRTVSHLPLEHQVLTMRPS